jgi:hypothetical protein
MQNMAFVSQVQKVDILSDEDMNTVIKGWEERGFFLHQIIPLNNGHEGRVDGNDVYSTMGFGYSYTLQLILVFRKES